MSTNDISMGYSIDRLPERLPRSVVIGTLLDAVRYNKELPDGWEVTWNWRNSKKQALRSAPFARAVRESRGGFLNLMIRRLSRDAGIVPPAPRDATAAELRAIEEEEEDTADRRQAEKPGQATRQRAARRARKVVTVRRVARRAIVVWRTKDGRFTSPPRNTSVRRRRESAALQPKRKKR